MSPLSLSRVVLVTDTADRAIGAKRNACAIMRGTRTRN